MKAWAIVILLAAPASAAADCADMAAYGRLLSKHTRPVVDLTGVAVDYEGVRRDPDLKSALNAMGLCAPSTLQTREQKLAFWINAYNLFAIDLVAKGRPPESIRDLGNLLRPVWKRDAGTIGGRAYSLAKIEHEILRPLGEPRIHAAIVCASRSCPSLRREPFVPGRLDTQLDEQMRTFLADERKGAKLEGPTLRLSKIFDWFEEDFEASGGVVAFVKPLLAFRIPANPRLAYFDYDWSLNSLSGSRTEAQRLQ
jgi:hypothetical protein